MDRRTLFTIGAVALLLGALTPLMAAADGYDELGTVDEGVYAVTSEDSRLRVQANEGLQLVVATPDGALVDAQHMAADEERTFVLDAEEALVAVQGGAAEIEAKGEGSVDAAETATETIQLVEAEDEAVDRSLTVQVPEGTLLAHADLTGEARELELEIATEERELLTASEADLAAPEPLAPGVAEADALDVRLDAGRLNGSIAVDVVRPAGPLAEPASTSDPQESDTDEGFSASTEVGEIRGEAIEFTVPEGEPGQLVVDLESGYVFDASVYDANGTQVRHLHAGAPLEEAREQCQPQECWAGWHDHEEFAPQTLEHELEPGSYVLYVREAWTEGELSIHSSEGPVLAEADAHEPTTLEVGQDRTLALEQPLLDVFRSVSYRDARALPSMTVNVDNATVYHLSAAAKSFGYAVEPELELNPGGLGSGDVTVTIDSATDDAYERGEGVYLVLFDG